MKRRITSHLWTCAIVFAICVTTTAVAQSVSEPAVGLPAVPDATAADVEIVDLDEAPPVAREAIVQLVLLGAYPLDAEMRAFPNALLDARTAAFMLVNLFALRDVEEFPVPADAAFAYFDVLTGSDAAPEDTVTVLGMRAYILGFVALVVDDPQPVGIALDERYPALRAGNPDTPLTRAGASLMLIIALETLVGSAA